MIADAFAAFAETFSPPLRRILFKVVGLALLLLVVLGTILHGLLTRLFSLPAPFETALAIVAGLGIFAGAIFLVPPITSLVAAFFVDDIAEHVERTNFPADPPGRPLPLAQSIVISAKFFGIVLGGQFPGAAPAPGARHQYRGVLLRQRVSAEPGIFRARRHAPPAGRRRRAPCGGATRCRFSSPDS